MKTCLRITALLLLSSAPVLAQQGPSESESGWSAGFGLGVAIPATDALSDLADPNLAFSGFLTAPLAERLSLRFEGGWNGFNDSDDAEAACELVGTPCNGSRVAHVAGGVQMSWPGQVSPYGFFVLGVDNVRLGVPVDSSESVFALAFGGGVNWRLGGRWSVGADLHVNASFADADTLWFIVPSGQLVYGW